VTTAVEEAALAVVAEAVAEALAVAAEVADSVEVTVVVVDVVVDVEEDVALVSAEAVVVGVPRSRGKRLHSKLAYPVPCGTVVLACGSEGYCGIYIPFFHFVCELLLRGLI
jgi:hypothetical protein